MDLQTLDIPKLSFSGHDSFQCRQLWLKKGYDYLENGKKFNDPDAILKLGVGKNMVSSIRFWLKAFNIIDNDDTPTAFGKCLFDEKTGYDPYLEDEGSLWLLHYQLVKLGYASTYPLVFNEFRKEKLQFNRESFISYIKRTIEHTSDQSFNENTVSKDFAVFNNLYKNEPTSKSIEDSFSGILSELDLVKSTGNAKFEQWFIENSERDSLPVAVFLFAILDNPSYGDSITFRTLEIDWNSPGSIFALNRAGILNKISDMVDKYEGVTYSDQAGVKELQFSKKLDSYAILDEYYGK